MATITVPMKTPTGCAHKNNIVNPAHMKLSAMRDGAGVADAVGNGRGDDPDQQAHRGVRGEHPLRTAEPHRDRVVRHERVERHETTHTERQNQPRRNCRPMKSRTATGAGIVVLHAGLV